MAPSKAASGHQDLSRAAIPESEAARADVARAAWGQITRLFLSQQDRRAEAAAQLGLAATDLISLFHIQPGAGIIQRDLASQWDCDPSWVTARIDRLESLGLVERRADDRDRRVKVVWLTEKGRATRDAGLDAFNRPPDVLLSLRTRDLAAMARALGQLDLPDPTQIMSRHRPTADPGDPGGPGGPGGHGGHGGHGGPEHPGRPNRPGRPRR